MHFNICIPNVSNVSWDEHETRSFDVDSMYTRISTCMSNIRTRNYSFRGRTFSGHTVITLPYLRYQLISRANSNDKRHRTSNILLTRVRTVRHYSSRRNWLVFCAGATLHLTRPTERQSEWNFNTIHKISVPTAKRELSKVCRAQAKSYYSQRNAAFPRYTRSEHPNLCWQWRMSTGGTSWRHTRSVRCERVCIASKMCACAC